MSTDSNQIEEALTSIKLTSLQKKLNAQSWNSNMEYLIQTWGEKAAGLRYMHFKASADWKKFSNVLSLSSIIITTVASGISLVAVSITEEETKNIVLYCVGGLGICSSMLQSMKKFYNAEEKAADHNSISKQFGSFYRYATLQMALTKEDRLPADRLTDYSLKEYQRMQHDAPELGDAQIKLYNKMFKSAKQSKPDICQDNFQIYIYSSPTSSADDEIVSTEGVLPKTAHSDVELSVLSD
jgi:hypothetical protein